MTDPMVAVAATFNCDPVIPLLSDAVSSIAVPHQVSAAPYGQLAEQFLATGSLFARNVGGINAGLVRPADWFSAPGDPRGVERIEAFATAVRQFCSSHIIPTVVAICPNPLGNEWPELADRLAGALHAVSGVAVGRVADWAQWYGCESIHDPNRDSLAHVPYTDEALAVIAIGLTRVVNSVRSRPKKVIAVDCDHTLWGGACNELGPDELDLGERYRSVQRFLKTRHEMGFLLALCSRNHQADVERVFAERSGDMVLTRDDFVARRVGWAPKWQLITSLAEELDLGVDSFALVDDDPYVCAETSQMLPEVTVVHLAADADPLAALRDCWELDRYFVTREDRSRHGSYRAKALAAATNDIGQLNKQLDTVVSVDLAKPEDTQRIDQLLSRTNQFTSATVSGPDLQRLLADGATAWVASLRDRFGDYGAVATAVTSRTTDGSFRVECFAMSCRVLNRGVAEDLFARITEEAGDRALHVRFRDTGRNNLAHQFLREYPMHRVPGKAGEETDYLWTGGK